ncbi:hypothetical protein [Cellulophaga sp. Hel_I_12]|uniref:hypothetical protein n=1 Tax=Cellulophaga sp. Hel_I_12 TaxID=1249972 RepID=UPI0006478DE1|nr:hypothetical protein [Cellulophaga sp. Hel_I_12]
MKKLSTLLLLATLAIMSCKEEKKQETIAPMPELTILEKVANAHGFDAWNSINEIQFIFNVDRDTTHFERKWTWNTKTNEVTGSSMGQSTTYNRKMVDSTSTNINAAFINDKFWLLAPYQLVWDAKNFTYNHVTNATAPISNKPMQKLTIVYGAEGGTTPGDAYDFYFEEDYLLKEWVFRKGNQTEASMTTTWEDYSTINGLKIAQSHKKDGENFNLYFTGIEVE